MTSDGSKVSNELFRKAWSMFPTGVTVVTADVEIGGQTHCMTANAVCSVSLDPMLVLVSIAHSGSTNAVVRRIGRYGLNFLGSHQTAVAVEHASMDGVRVAPPGHRAHPEGALLLDDAVVSMDCAVVETVEVGDHTLFIGRVEAIEIQEGAPLVFHKGKFTALS